MKNLKIRRAVPIFLWNAIRGVGRRCNKPGTGQNPTRLCSRASSRRTEENPLPAIDAASVQESSAILLYVGCNLWLSVLLHQPGDLWRSDTGQQAVVDGVVKAVQYERYINRSEMKRSWSAGSQRMAWRSSRRYGYRFLQESRRWCWWVVC